MSAAPFNLGQANRRSCFWTPDYSSLSLLKPLPGRVLNIGPSTVLQVSDAANQSIAASTTQIASFTTNGLVPGSWNAPGANQVVLFELLLASIITADTSGKLQIGFAQLGNGGTGFVSIAALAYPMPFTFPALTGVQFQVQAALPITPCYPPATGPSANFLLTNTDTAAHTYTRRITMRYRVVDGVDQTSGPSLPGAGL